MLTTAKKKDLMSRNTANVIAGNTEVQSLPAGRAKSNCKIERISGEPAILTPIFKDKLSSIEWALTYGYQVKSLSTILDGM